MPNWISWWNTLFHLHPTLKSSHKRTVAEFALPAFMKGSLPCLVVLDNTGDEKVAVGESDIVLCLNKNFAACVDGFLGKSGELKDRAIAVINDTGILLAGILHFGLGRMVGAAAEDAATALVPCPSKPLTNFVVWFERC